MTRATRRPPCSVRLGRRGPLAVIGLAIACSHGGRTATPTPAREGVSIALYEHQGGGAYAVVDDRRWVEVAGDSLVIDRVDPGCALPSLVIEPLSGGALELGACLRERIAAAPAPGAASAPDATPATPEVGGRGPGAAAERVSPVLRCAVRAAPGRYLVRVLYVSPALGYRAQHDLVMIGPDRATVASRFAIVTPAWQAHAEVTLFDGTPGGEHPPREVARGPIMLDGGTAVIAAPPRVVGAQLRWIYRGAVHDDDDARRDSQPAVWVWLELAGVAIAPGPVRAHVELAGEPARDIAVPAAGRRQAAAALRLPLWIDDQLRGKRDRWTGSQGDATVTDRLTMSVASTGGPAREVWIEEKLRPSRRRTVARAWPGEPIIVENLLRMKLTVPGGKASRAGFEIAYDL